MDARVGAVVVWITSAMPAGRRGGGGGGNAADTQATLAGWLHPAVPWTPLIVGLAALAFLSAVLSAMSWSGSRKNHDIRSIGRRTLH